MAIDIEKRNQRQYAWQKEQKERINILFEKGTKDRIKAAAAKLNINTSEFIRSAIDEKIDRCMSTGSDKAAGAEDPEKITENNKYY